MYTNEDGSTVHATAVVASDVTNPDNDVYVADDGWVTLPVKSIRDDHWHEERLLLAPGTIEALYALVHPTEQA